MKSSKRRVFCKDCLVIRICPKFLLNSQIVHIYVKDKDLAGVTRVVIDGYSVAFAEAIVKKYKSLALTN